MMSHGEYKQPVLLNRVDKRVAELPEQTPADTGQNLFTRFRELCDEILGPPNIGEEASSETISSKFEVADLIEQLVLGGLMVLNGRHRNNLSAFFATSFA